MVASNRRSPRRRQCGKFTFAAPLTFAILLGVGSTSAEPISIVYSVQTTHRCNPDGCNPFLTGLPLTMTFDSGVTSQFDRPGEHGRAYGPPSFSTVPLERPAVAPTASVQQSTSELAVAIDGQWRHAAGADQVFNLVTPQLEYRWTLFLFRLEDSVSQPEFSPHGMAEFLGRGRNQDRPDASGFFSYGFEAADPQNRDRFHPDTVVYQGFATLPEPQAPIPDPLRACWLAPRSLELCVGSAARRLRDAP
jgi:hypothetical protein